MSFLRKFVISAAAAVFVAFGAAGEARAGCYEIIGCTDADYFREPALRRLSCHALGEVRNSIFAENGYCFKAVEYRRIWGNRDCRYAHADDVPLTRIERANVVTIHNVEEMKDCLD